MYTSAHFTLYSLINSKSADTTWMIITFRPRSHGCCVLYSKVEHYTESLSGTLHYFTITSPVLTTYEEVAGNHISRSWMAKARNSTILINKLTPKPVVLWAHVVDMLSLDMWGVIQFIWQTPSCYEGAPQHHNDPEWENTGLPDCPWVAEPNPRL